MREYIIYETKLYWLQITAILFIANHQHQSLEEGA